MKSALLCAVICLLVCQTTVLSQSSRTFKQRQVQPPASERSQARAPSTNLPIRRVILYSNGVAYIERRGVISNHAEISLSFKQSQVDDVLKSMVVLDLGKGRIGAVSYNSSAPPSSRMSEIPFAISASTDGNNGGGLAGVLSQLQGARVVVSTANRTVSGSILTVEAKHSQIDSTKPPVTTHRVVIASDNGEVSGFDLNELRSLQLADEGSRRDLSEFAHAAAAARRRDAKTIVVTSDGTGEREMIISYTIAAPIWKTTYRVVLDEKGKPFFQGWAIVDNISEEDWNGIQLSLVSGTPISFIQPIQNPVYRYRPVVPLQQDLNLKPQTYEPTEMSSSSAGSVTGSISDPNGAVIAGVSVVIKNEVSNQSFEVTTNSEGQYLVGNLSPGRYTMSVSAGGFQKTVVNNILVRAGNRTNFDLEMRVATVTETVTIDGSNAELVNTQAATLGSNFSSNTISKLPTNGRNVVDLLTVNPGIAKPRTPIANLVAGEQSGVETKTRASEVGDLFEYRIEQPVTVPRDRSALIPILQTRMEGERISIFNENGGTNRPMSGMLLKNTSALTLDDGALTVIDGDAYAGEALLDRLKPTEERLISFALDLGTLVNVRNGEARKPTYLVKVHDGIAATYYFTERKKTYTIVNQTNQPRTVYLEHPRGTDPGWQIDLENHKPDLITARHYRFRVVVKPHEKVDFPVAERRENYDTFQLAALTRTELDFFVSSRYIDDKTRLVLEKLIDLKTQITRVDAQVKEVNRQATEITQDQQRLRENIQTLTSTAEAKQLIARYVAKANEQETRLEQIEKERLTLSKERARLQSELADAIRSVSLDRKVD